MGSTSILAPIADRRRPVSEAGPSYTERGWQWLPLPYGCKKSPPEDTTGYRGRMPTNADRAAWLASRPGDNIALRLPPDVVGIDVDVYNGGGATLADLKAKYGPLPDTVASTSRTDGSGILLYRVPVGTVLVGKLEPGIEVCQFHHRYVIAAPSMHLEGREYRWLDTLSGEVLEYPPPPWELPELPWKWIEGLAVTGKGKHADRVATADEVLEFIDAHTEANRPAALKGIRTTLAGRNQRGGKGGRHDTLVEIACWAMREAAAGYYSAADALDVLEEWWQDKAVADPTRDTDPGEFPSAIAWAVAEAQAEPERIAALRDRPEPPRADALEPWNGAATVDPDPDPPPRPVLSIEDIATIAARVDATPPPQFIARPVWPADAYGVLAAENKAGKSWAALDLAVSVAAGTAWMGLWPCEAPGPVLVFLGEGSERKTVRRLRAVCAFHGVRLEDLPLRVSHRSPKLSDVMHLGEIAAELAETPAALVIVDPLYLSAGGANGASLYDMGEVLGAVQYVAQAAGAALVVVHHWNQTGTGKDRSRMSGAGPAEWGRVLVSVSVDERRTEPDRTSVVTLGWQIIGDEIPDTDVKVVRRVRATDPDDLASPMTYRVDPAGITADAPEWDGPKECMAAITAWFTEHPDEELSKRAVAERLRAFGLSYRDRTVGDALERLAVEQVLTVRRGARNARLFGLAREHPLLELEAV